MILRRVLPLLVVVPLLVPPTASVAATTTTTTRAARGGETKPPSAHAQERTIVKRTSSGEWVEPAALPRAIESPRLVVHKSKREIQLLSGGSVLRTYRVALGLEPVRPKEKQGDYATPEGTYYICSKNPQSKYQLALGLSYPGPDDAERGLAAGLISSRERDAIVAACKARRRPPSNTKLGGDIMIHGDGSSWDWTAGCIALNYMDIEEIYRVVPVGTSVEIRP
jgi:L,D-peptidoglycan transpeptidase YkuD (ErfK/YbiS/YcfS/YnhG family)